MEIDQDISCFRDAVWRLAAGADTYALRADVCERSRFVWFSAKEAAAFYHGVLENHTSPEGSRAAQIDSLFKEAIRLLSSQADGFYRNTVLRYEELQPILAHSLA